mmetsp:Transcript_10058/g.24618  ORF Transcript_10058/g.24618 Transcript_10058/m.24618 type:complete len:537 (+) Transcript_10058:227-1837(+)|eukprot:CAMPEP_0181095150 /NCGR_PEP_ID=MMETSP1071-20121207/10369_1 /TAXON_ID=35127 /ORGANISM="Thalassiosira sp., Strain NH16" /LENGTH=536 /DNA_ID=CAMNT_0023177519 /DNA_START=222 /DNA_END=1832 /DNA_ORIENTATION=+
MPPPTKSNGTAPKHPSWRRLKTGCKCISIAAVPIYATTLVLIVRISTNDPVIVSPSTTPFSEQFGMETGDRLTPPPLDGDTTSYTSIAREIAAKWNLTAPEAPHLLEKQFYRTDNYDLMTDFLHFHHIPKTGGTTISDMINATLGSLVDGHRGIMPGSERSGPFVPDKFYKLTGIKRPLSSASSNNHGEHDFPYLASYAHTRLRPIHGPNKTELASFFEEYFALHNNTSKRLRSLAMLREPMDLRASNHAMAQCSINGRVREFNLRRKQNGLEPVCSPEQGLNISALWDATIDKAMAKCPNGRVLPNVPKLDKYERILCKRGTSALDICGSVSKLLSSSQYKASMRAMLKSVMARYTAQEQMGWYDYHAVEDFMKRTGWGFTTEKVEQYTLVDLGGLDSNNILHTSYNGYLRDQESIEGANSNQAEPDILWFGITERMRESTCLLYYTLNVKPLKKVPRMRVMDCSPTSWWTEEHRERVKRGERADYAVWRTANAILDARMMKMQENVRMKLQREEDLTSKERDQYMALAEAGCLE